MGRSLKNAKSPPKMDMIKTFPFRIVMKIPTITVPGRDVLLFYILENILTGPAKSVQR